MKIMMIAIIQKITTQGVRLPWRFQNIMIFLVRSDLLRFWSAKFTNAKRQNEGKTHARNVIFRNVNKNIEIGMKEVMSPEEHPNLFNRFHHEGDTIRQHSGIFWFYLPTLFLFSIAFRKRIHCFLPSSIESHRRP